MLKKANCFFYLKLLAKRKLNENSKDVEIGEILVTDESTQVIDANGKVLDTQPTPRETIDETRTNIKEGHVFLSCEDLKKWIENAKEWGCTIEKSDREGVFCMTCRNPDGTTTVTVIDTRSNTVRSSTEIDREGKTTSVIAYESECNGTFLTPKTTVQETYTYGEGGTKTTTSVTTVYTNYEVTQK